ncbi:unnamed protein product [Paramecium octaurelia]|uniref:Uncharacterized protein n=1 Tax=Paramecium octaurelia TaxID=43137 RepID=A0A8S1X253_PAROT|nr:unnamed protein product [Paramecium octaurelia]
MNCLNKLNKIRIAKSRNYLYGGRNDRFKTVIFCCFQIKMLTEKIKIITFYICELDCKAAAKYVVEVGSQFQQVEVNEEPIHDCLLEIFS